jgi:hypothetical protein
MTGSRNLERCVALFILGVVLLLPPMLLVFNRPDRVMGIPILFLYIFLVWGALIALAAAIARSFAREEPPTLAPGEAPPPVSSGAAAAGGHDA